jgi:serine phosphatase RsbU (regulator of sigma subunit)
MPARIGGDFFDFAAINGRLVVVLLDIAGDRNQAFPLAVQLQERFRALAPDLFAHDDLNEAVALSDLLLDLNRTLIDATGVHCSPAFLACYNEDLGTLLYINAGHVPGVLHDAGGAALLHPVGLPLGLFSHAMHDAQASVLAPGATLLLTSRGVLEAHSEGLEGLQAFVSERAGQSPEQICQGLLDDLENRARRSRRLLLFGNGGRPNDRTVLALVRGSTPPPPHDLTKSVT